MKRLLAGLACLAAVAAHAQDGATLFNRQCGVCHVAQEGSAPRKPGPNLWGVFGRKAGGDAGFRYSRGLAAAEFVWDEARLDAYLTNPQAVVAGGTMAYRQPSADIRSRIIGWLKEQR